jgi:hypothetical protein
VNRISSKGLTKYQNTWVGRIVLIFFDYSTVESREVDLVKLEPISIRLFLGVIGYSDLKVYVHLFFRLKSSPICQDHAISNMRGFSSSA